MPEMPDVPHGNGDEMDPDAPLDGLRAAWQALQAPEPTAQVDLPDRETQAMIDWLRRAWRRASPSPSHVDAPLPWRIRLRLLRPRVAPVLAAAAALLLLALLLETPRRSADSVPITSGPVVAAQPVAEESAATAPLAVDATSTQSAEKPPTITPTVAPSDRQRSAAITNDRMELRSGPVRLILFTPLKPSDTKEQDR